MQRESGKRAYRRTSDAGCHIVYRLQIGAYHTQTRMHTPTPGYKKGKSAVSHVKALKSWNLSKSTARRKDAG